MRLVDALAVGKARRAVVAGARIYLAESMSHAARPATRHRLMIVALSLRVLPRGGAP
jgi:hypothetical protein